MRMLLVDLWGGLPRVMHADACDAHAPWAGQRRDDVLLPDAAAQPFESTLNALRAVGVHVHVVGATGATAAHVVRGDGFPPPSLAYADTVSVYDGAAMPLGSEVAHDRLAVSDAHRILDADEDDDDPSKPPLALVVRLLACRDLPHVRFEDAAMDTPRRKRCVVDCVLPHAGAPHLAIPALAHTPCAAARTYTARDCERFQEDCSARTSSAQAQHLHALARARHASLLAHLAPLLVRARDLGVHVALTASRSIPLGEHGLRATASPMGCTCTTLWCASTPASTPATESTSLFDVVDAFARRAFRMSIAPAVWPSITIVDETHTRVLTTLRTRTYALVCAPRKIIHIFAVDEDPLETSDVTPWMAHAREELQALANATFADVGFTASVRSPPPPPPARPPTPTPPARPPTPLVVHSPTPPRPPPIALPHSPARAAVQSKDVQHKRVSVRRKENVLIQRHK